MNKQPFPWGKFLKKLAIIAIPIALQNLLTTTASIVDTVMVGKLGENAIAALGLCVQYSSLMFSCYWGFVGGGMLFFSQYWGSREDDGIERSYGLTLTCMMTVAVIFSVFATFFPELIMKLYTDKEDIRVIGVEYLKYVGLAYIMQIFSICMSTVLRATERVAIPLTASIASVGTNVFLNWVFIYGNLGAPAMGVKGAAIATSVAACVNVVVTLVFAACVKYPYLFRFRGHFRWTKESVRLFFKKCFPIICNEFLLGVGNMIIGITLGRQTEAVIAAVAVFRTLEGLIIGFFAGFSSASSVIVGAGVGAGEHRKAYESAIRVVYLCSAFIAVSGAVIFAFHGPIFRLMNLSGDAFEACKVLLGIYLIVAVIRMGNWIMNDTYRSAGDAVTGTVLEIVFMYFMLVPAILITAFVIKAPYWVIFICCYIDEPIRYTIMQIHMYSGKWIRPVTDIGKAELPAFRASLENKKRIPVQSDF